MGHSIKKVLVTICGTLWDIIRLAISVAAAILTIFFQIVYEISKIILTILLCSVAIDALSHKKKSEPEEDED